MSTSRYHDISTLEPRAPIEDYKTHIVAILEDLIRQYPPSHHHTTAPHGIFYGPTSIAYTFLRLSSIYPEILVSGKPCRELCSLYLKNPRHRTTSPERCGVGDEVLAHLSVKACLYQDETIAMQICSSDLTSFILDEAEAGSDEWLYGRAGYLYLLRMLRAYFPKEKAELHHALTQAIEMTIIRILKSPRPWKWHGKEYLGAVHGSIGIITQIILSSPSHAPALEKEIDGLLDLQLESGNWDSSNESHHSDELVQTCHGAPGFVVSLLSIARLLPSEHPMIPRIHDSIKHARETIKKRGFLTKEPCLCHGVTGNALALGKEDMLQFLAYTTQEAISEGFSAGMFKRGVEDSLDERMGLWTGAAGRVWGFVVARKVGECQDGRWEGSMLGYNDL
ncbi:hypothetical protein DFH27DRAFT_21606 [Peziza echinospora]|nr:hypothetical protein DFH27DRAFT_21606 [Peziza echinospora]